MQALRGSKHVTTIQFNLKSKVNLIQNTVKVTLTSGEDVATSEVADKYTGSATE